MKNTVELISAEGWSPYVVSEQWFIVRDVGVTVWLDAHSLGCYWTWKGRAKSFWEWAGGFVTGMCNRAAASWWSEWVEWVGLHVTVRSWNGDNASTLSGLLIVPLLQMMDYFRKKSMTFFVCCSLQNDVIKTSCFVSWQIIIMKTYSLLSLHVRWIAKMSTRLSFQTSFFPVFHGSPNQSAPF